MLTLTGRQAKFYNPEENLKRMASVMRFEIPCETYLRLRHTALTSVSHLNCVRIEYRNGVALALTLDRSFIACQKLDKIAPELEGAVNLIYDETLIDQAQAEVNEDGVITIDVVPILGYGKVSFSSGYVYPGNGINSTDGEEWRDWRKIIPEQPAAESKGVFFCNAERFAALAKTSPSGRIVFPSHINEDILTVVRDSIDPDWFGVFRITDRTRKPYAPATIPDWVR